MASKNFSKYLKALLRNAPISHFLGHRLISCSNGSAEVRLPFRPEFQQSYGVVHGGVIFTIADTAGYFAAASVSPEQVVTTVELKINLLKKAKTEKWRAEKYLRLLVDWNGQIQSKGRAMKSAKIFNALLLMLFCLLFNNCGEKKKASVPHFVTRWSVKAAFKYDLCSFAGILTGRELYKKHYGDLYAEWSRKLPRPVAEAVKKIDEVIGPNHPPGPRLCVLLSAVAAEDSIAAILRAMDDDAAVRHRLMASDFGSERNWQQWQTLKPFLRSVFEFLQKENFEGDWHKNLHPKITAKLPRIQQELKSYDVIGDLERFLVEADFGDSLQVNVLWLLQPHAVRINGQRYLTDASYPMHITVKSAYHETLHPFCERMVDSVLATQFESLKTDPFLQQVVAAAAPATGYKNFKTYCKEEVVLAADLWVAERRRVISQYLGTDGIDSRVAVRKYLEKHEGGVHALAAVIYSFLEAGLKLDRMSYAEFLKELFASGRLQPGKIERRYQEFMQNFP